MKIKILLYATISTFILGGCAQNTMGVAPSQNKPLQAVSPSDTAASEGGMMQRSLDSWLKEEWSPMTSAPAPTVKTTTSPDGTVVQTKTEVIPAVTTTTAPDGKAVQTKTQTTQVVTTTTAPTGEVVTTTTAVEQTVVEPVDETPFTLQKYVDKWKVYNENKEKMNEGKPKEASTIDKIQSMPVIGK